jgi:hypothetical protein
MVTEPAAAASVNHSRTSAGDVTVASAAGTDRLSAKWNAARVPVAVTATALRRLAAKIRALALITSSRSVFWSVPVRRSGVRR